MYVSEANLRQKAITGLHTIYLSVEKYIQTLTIAMWRKYIVKCAAYDILSRKWNRETAAAEIKWNVSKKNGKAARMALTAASAAALSKTQRNRLKWRKYCGGENAEESGNLKGSENDAPYAHGSIKMAKKLRWRVWLYRDKTKIIIALKERRGDNGEERRRNQSKKKA